MVIKEPSKKGKLSKSTVLNPRNWNIVDLCLCITLEIILLAERNKVAYQSLKINKLSMSSVLNYADNRNPPFIRN